MWPGIEYLLQKILKFDGKLKDLCKKKNSFKEFFKTMKNCRCKRSKFRFFLTSTGQQNRVSVSVNSLQPNSLWP